MPLLRKDGVLAKFGNSLISVPAAGQSCICCTRYACVPGSTECQHCVESPSGTFVTIEECEAACPQETCIWCIEDEWPGPCGEPYYVYRCVQTFCDETGTCIEPNGVIVAGPVKVEDLAEADCAAICPPQPPPPEYPDCCGDEDCPCCYNCVNGYCVECPPGTVCINCECVPIDEAYYCCQDPTEYGSPPPAPYCTRGPCAPPATTVGGPYRDYTSCCTACGCRFYCDQNYNCQPGPAGEYATIEECEESCYPPPDGSGVCCYTIAPYSDDNNYNKPPFDVGCAIVKGCFGIMSFEACEALNTDTGTTTQWYDEYDNCSFCPITASHVCCYPNPDNECELLCSETDTGCCEDFGGTSYEALRTCDERWPSGAEACRQDGCVWPFSETFGPVSIGGSTHFWGQLFFPVQGPPSPPPFPPPNGSPPCIKAPIWSEGYPAALEDCNCRWVYDYSRCFENANPGNATKCERWRLWCLRAAQFVDLTFTATRNNPEDFDCCGCEDEFNWIDPCEGDECTPLPFLDDPEPLCPP